MVAPIWEGVTLIPDEITKAANGQIVITAVMLYAIQILRSKLASYKQQVPSTLRAMIRQWNIAPSMRAN